MLRFNSGEHKAASGPRPYRHPVSRKSFAVALSVAGACAFAAMAQTTLTAPAPPPPGVQAVSPSAAYGPALSPAQTAVMLRVLNDVESHGFERADFLPAGLEAALKSPDPAVRRRGETQLQQAVLAYARAQHGARIPASAFLDDWAVRPDPYDGEREFGLALGQNKVAEWLAALPPQFEGYRGLRAALVRYRALAAEGGWQPIAEGPALKPGMTGPRVVQLRQRLAREDRALDGADVNPMFDPALAEAVARFQVRSGLKGDSLVGKPTLAALNTPIETRIAQVEANLERWRWLPREWPATRLEVNIAGATLSYYQDNRLVTAMRAVAGRPSDKSPMLRSEVHSLVFNPPWNVPASIASKELLPKGGAYLAANGYVTRVVDGGGTRLQQLPGPNNALGQVKFDFENRFGVYLHDTPGQAAFARDVRTLSHGCIRLEHPIALAKLLFQGEPAWSEEKIDDTLAGGETTRAKLSRTVPVFILYWTAFTDQNGQLNFRNDVYNWDRQVAGLLDAGQKRA